MHYLDSPTALVNQAPVTGQYRAYRPKGLIRRVFDPAELHTGTTVLVIPTVVQCAILARVNRTHVHWAIKRLAERDQIEAGPVPLVPPSARATIRQAPGGHNLPISTIAIPDFFELLNFIRCIGIDRVLNVMVAAEAVDNSQSTVTGVAGRLDWPAAPQPKAAERTSMSQFGTARMSLRDRCATYAGDGRTAYKIVNSLFASIIVALRRDPRFRNVQAFDLELLLADTRVSAERLLIRELKVRVHLDDIGEDP